MAEAEGHACFTGYVLGDRCFATAPPQTSELKTEKYTKLSCFNNRGACSHELADDSPMKCKNKLS